MDEIQPDSAEYSSWGTFTQLADKNQQNLRQILEAAATAKAAPGSNEQKIGDFLRKLHDTAAIDVAGTNLSKPDLARIAAIKSVADLQAVVEYLHSQGIGAFFVSIQLRTPRTVRKSLALRFKAVWDYRSANIT